jgi:hypothetical protein
VPQRLFDRLLLEPIVPCDVSNLLSRLLSKNHRLDRYPSASDYQPSRHDARINRYGPPLVTHLPKSPGINLLQIPLRVPSDSGSEQVNEFFHHKLSVLAQVNYVPMAASCGGFVH